MYMSYNNLGVYYLGFWFLYFKPNIVIPSNTAWCCSQQGTFEIVCIWYLENVNLFALVTAINFKKKKKVLPNFFYLKQDQQASLISKFITHFTANQQHNCIICV